MIFDTHAHLNASEFDNDRDELIKKCLKEGIGMINVGTNFKDSKKAVEIAENYPDVFASIGLHPTSIYSQVFKNKEYAGREELLEKDFDYNAYKSLKTEKVVAVGEIGLDYWRRPKGESKKELFKQEQKIIFERQLDLAEELDLPIIIHCRSAFDDLFEILSKRKVRGVLHCFTGTKEEAEKALSLGLYIGIDGIIFKIDLREVIKIIPMDKILIETDCPYLSPPQFEERNNPLSLPYIIDEIAKIKGVETEEVKEATLKNTKELFNIGA
ncbi:MAG: TatD family hydrolase [Minisyncoccales bacterium]